MYEQWLVGGLRHTVVDDEQICWGQWLGSRLVECVSRWCGSCLSSSSGSGTLFYILHASWALQSLRVGFLKPLLVGAKRRKLVLLLSVGAEEICEDGSLPHSTAYCTGWFLSMNILLSFPFTSGVPCLFSWAIVLMHWWLINVVCAI